MRRGEVWLVRGLGGDRYVLIVGNDALSESARSILAAPIDTAELTTPDLVTVRLTAPVSGMARVNEMGPVRRHRFEHALGGVDGSSMDMVDAALRTALDL